MDLANFLWLVSAGFAVSLVLAGGAGGVWVYSRREKAIQEGRFALWVVGIILSVLMTALGVWLSINVFASY